MEVHDWPKIVNKNLFAMMVVNAWLAFICFTLSEDTQKEFYTIFTEEIIDNSYENSNMAWKSCRNGGDGNASASPTLAAGTGAPRGGVAAHITPTKRRRIIKYGSITKCLMQGKCMEFKNKRTYLCSQYVDDKVACLTNSTHVDPWICATKNDKLCYANNMNGKHLF